MSISKILPITLNYSRSPFCSDEIEDHLKPVQF